MKTRDVGLLHSGSQRALVIVLKAAVIVKAE